MEEHNKQSKHDGDFHLIDERPVSKSDWDIGELYGKSKDIVRNNKVTWIFGAAVASLAASSGNFNSSSSSNDSNGDSFKKLFESIPNKQEATEKISMVLGEATTPFQRFLNELWQIIPTWVYFVLGIEILALILIGITVKVIYGAWAQASLISSVQAGYLNQKPSIASSAEQGFKHIKSVVLLSVVPTLVLLIVIPLSVILFIILFSIGSTALKVLGGILIFVEVIGLIYVLLLFSVTLNWAIRLVVISNIGTKEAFYRGMRIARKKFWPSLLLGGVNTILSSIILSVPWIIFAVFAVGFFIAVMAGSDLSGLFIGIGSVLFIVVLVITTVMSAIIEAFKASTWTIAYDKIKGKYDE